MAEVAANAPTLLLDHHRVLGTDGCNRFTGEFLKMDVPRLGFVPLATTEMACGDAVAPLRQAVGEALSGATVQASTHGRQLLLESGEIRLVHRR